MCCFVLFHRYWGIVTVPGATADFRFGRRVAAVTIFGLQTRFLVGLGRTYLRVANPIGNFFFFLALLGGKYAT